MRDVDNWIYSLLPESQNSRRYSIANTDAANAEVQIIRTALTRADLEYHKIEVEHTSNSLVIKGIQEPQPRRSENVQVNHQVILKLPRRIDLAVSSVSGSLKAGDVDGDTVVSSIGGSADTGNVPPHPLRFYMC